MSYLLKFFKFLMEGINRIFSFILSLPGMIATAFATLGESLYEGFEFLMDNSSVVSDACSRVDSAASAVAGSDFVESELFRLFVHTLALDQLWAYLVGAFAFFISALALVLITVVPFLIVFGFSCTIVNASRNIVNSFIPGMAKF